nr:MAG TPA: hypothetical protein [Caudoviricetes sp.]
MEVFPMQNRPRWAVFYACIKLISFKNNKV